MHASFTTLVLAAAVSLVAATAADTALAESPSQQMRNHKTFFIQRYPGDQAIAGGTARMHGPEQGPYIERCYWTASNTLFGLPLGLTQHCHRYTLENTPPRE